MAVAAVASALGSAVGEIAAKLLEPIIEPFLEAGGAAIRLVVMDMLGISKVLAKEPMAVIEGAEPDPATGLTADGIAQALHDDIWSAVKTMFIHPELADEFVLELISEAVSNAIQYNLGGAVQTILNTWRGSYPLEPGDLNNVVAQQLDVLDIPAAFILAASAGATIPFTAAQLIQGVNQSMQQQYSAAEARLVETMSRLESLALLFHRVAEEVATRVIIEALEAPVVKTEYIMSMLRYMYERAASRLQEYLAELMILKMYKDAGVLKPEEADRAALIVTMEAESLYDAVKEMEEILIDALESVASVDLKPVIDEVRALLAEVARAYIPSVEALARDARETLDSMQAKVSGVLSLLTMVRTLYKDKYETLPPVETPAKEPEYETPEPTAVPEVSSVSEERG